MWKNKDSGGILNSLSLLCNSSFLCSIKKIHKHRSAKDSRHRSGTNVLLIGLAELPFFFFEISWACVAKLDLGVMVYTDRNDCFCFVKVNYNDMLSARGPSLSR